MLTRNAALVGLAAAMTIGGPYRLHSSAMSGDPPQSDIAKAEALRRAVEKRARRAAKRVRTNAER